MTDLAHIHHVELLTPEPERSLAYFHDVLGMEIESRAGQSVFLRGWGEYQPYSLKLTEAATSGLDHLALRANSAEALTRQVEAIEAAGLGDRLARRRPRPRPRVPLPRPRRPRHRGPVGVGPLRRARPPQAVAAQPAAALHRARRGGQAARPRQPAGARRPRLPRVRDRHARLPPLRGHPARHRRGDRRLAQPHDRRPRADLRQGRARGRRPPPPPRVLGRHPRGVPARRRHLPRRRRPHRGGALPPRGRRRLLPLLVRAGRQPHRGHHRRLLRPRARPGAGDLDRGRARPRPGLGRQDRRELPLLRHAPDRRGSRLRGGGGRQRSRALAQSTSASIEHSSPTPIAVNSGSHPIQPATAHPMTRPKPPPASCSGAASSIP